MSAEAEAFQPTVWDFEDVVKGGSEGQQFQEMVGSRGELLKEFESFKGNLDSITVDDFQKVFSLYGQITNISSILEWYSMLLFAKDTGNKDYKVLMGKCKSLTADAENRQKFFDLWFSRLEDSKAKPFLDAAGNDRYFLELKRNVKPYLLSEDAEQVANSKNATFREGLANMCKSEISKISLEVIVDGKPLEDGKGGTKLNTAFLRKFRRDANPNIRIAVYDAFLNALAERKDFLGGTYLLLADDWNKEQINKRGYPQILSVRNISEGVSDKAVDTLLEVCRANTPILHDYVRIKQKLLKLDKMDIRHLQAPLDEVKKEITYPDSMKQVVGAYRQFDPEFADIVMELINRNHIDSLPSKGKMPGARCGKMAPGILPYIAFEFTGDLRNVKSMAHELGHGVHCVLSGRNNSVLTYGASGYLAETASIFGETIMFEKTIESIESPQLKLSLLASRIDEIRGSVYRQAYFTVFEKEAHKAVANGASVDKLGDIYSSCLKEQFGESLHVPEPFKWEWMDVDYLYDRAPGSPLSYVFGNIVTFALYQRYKEEGKSFIPGYKNLLAAGGSQSPQKLLGDMGIDICDKAFWQGGFNTIKGMVDEAGKCV